LVCVPVDDDGNERKVKIEYLTPNFKSKLKELGYTKAAFARFIGIDEQTARGWKTGDMPIYAERAIELLVLRGAIEKANVALEKSY